MLILHHSDEMADRDVLDHSSRHLLVHRLDFVLPVIPNRSDRASSQPTLPSGNDLNVSDQSGLVGITMMSVTFFG